MVVAVKSWQLRGARAPRAEELVAFLSDGKSFPERPRKVIRLETHISWVFLTDRYAYKLKKPVRFEFVDYSTPSLREQACRREVELNRRLAPGIYLGVVPISRDRRGRLRLGAGGVPVEWVVKMCRLPAERSLQALIESQTLSRTQVDQLAARLADFYQRLPPITLRTSAYRQHIADHVRANRQELLAPAHGLPDAAVRRTHAAQLRLLELFPALLENRVADGRVVAGHGDLRAEHVYFTPSPIVIDCLEFSEELRQLDVLDELSFLAMECDRLGTPWLGQRVVARYVQTSGDQPPAVLLWFYKSYRACVRAKVLALRAEQHPAAGREDPGAAAGRYLELAASYAVAMGPPLLLIVRGLAGTGKSTLARQLSETLGLDLLQTDAVRRDLFAADDRTAAAGGEKYRVENRVRVYAELLRRAANGLAEQRSLILDGTFLSARLLREADDLAGRHGAVPLFVDCYCPPATALERIAARQQAGEELSEATAQVYSHQWSEVQPIPADLPALPTDTTASLPSLVERVLQRLREAGPYRDLLREKVAWDSRPEQARQPAA